VLIVAVGRDRRDAVCCSKEAGRDLEGP
jgi:hypothetical protein